MEARLSAKSSSSSVRKAEQDALVKYYALADQGLLWVDENGLNQRGKAVIAEIKKADDYGLRASDYDLPNADEFNANNAKASDWLADAEIKISFAVLDYARDARGGRIDPQRLSDNLDPTLALPDPSDVIQSIARGTDPATYLRSFQSDQPQFEMLRRKLAELRGDSNSEKTGVDTGKISAILVNMERWRWLPNDLGPYYVNVNVPEFMLRVVDEGKVIHTARVVIGKPDKQTPIFYGEMQEIVFNPVGISPTPFRQKRCCHTLPRAEVCLAEVTIPIFSKDMVCTSNMGAERSILIQSIGAASIFVVWKSINRLDLITCLAMLNSCFPTSTTYICMTPRSNYYGQQIRARVMVVCV